VPICYVYDGVCVDGHTIEGMKRHAMQTNPQVWFEVERAGDLTTWRSVIDWGSYEELTGDDAAHGMRMLVDRLIPILRPATCQAQPNTPARHRMWCGGSPPTTRRPFFRTWTRS